MGTNPRSLKQENDGNRISLKLGATIIFLLLTVLLPLGFMIDQIIYGFYFEKEKQEIDDLSGRYASAIAHSKNRMGVQMVEMMAEFSQIPLYIVDEEGKVIANTGVPGMPAGTFIPQEDKVALAHGETVDTEYKISENGGRFLVSGNAIQSKDTFVGGVFVLSSVESIYKTILQVRLMLILSGIGAFFLALGFTLVFSRKLSYPLIEMKEATQNIAKGNLETRVEVNTRDETGTLVQAINNLAVDLKRYRDTRSELFANVSHELRTPMTYLG